MASKYFLTFYPGANEAAVVFGTSVGGWKKPNKHLPPAVPPSCDLTCPAVMARFLHEVDVLLSERWLDVLHVLSQQ